ncbi:MAG: hypothetical protein HOV92_16050 [Streptomyces sp.]|nr:hypothetical protein [Streptomyces sp.]
MQADLSPQPPGPELWRTLDEAARGCAPTPFPRERVVRRAATIRRRRRLMTVALAALLLTPAAGKLALDQEPTSSHAVAGTDRQQSPRPSASSGTADLRSPVRVVRPGVRIDVGLGVWYLLKQREFCPKHPIDKKPSCVGPLDRQQPGDIPMTLNWYPFPKGVVTVLAYTGKTPAARITMTDHGRTTVLPIVRLSGDPAYVSSYAISSPVEGSYENSPEGSKSLNLPVFRAYGADGEELAEIGG